MLSNVSKPVVQAQERDARAGKRKDPDYTWIKERAQQLKAKRRADDKKCKQWNSFRRFTGPEDDPMSAQLVHCCWGQHQVPRNLCEYWGRQKPNSHVVLFCCEECGYMSWLMDRERRDLNARLLHQPYFYELLKALSKRVGVHVARIAVDYML